MGPRIEAILLYKQECNRGVKGPARITVYSFQIVHFFAGKGLLQKGTSLVHLWNTGKYDFNAGSNWGQSSDSYNVTSKGMEIVLRYVRQAGE